MMNSLGWVSLRWALVGSILFATAGCLEVKHTILLKEDGSGQLVEKVWVADWVIQAAKSDPQLATLRDLFLEKSVRERMATYGPLTLVSHVVTNRGCHGMESLTVMGFADIDKLTLPAMLSGDVKQPGRITFTLGERHKLDTTTFSGWNYSVRRPLRISQSSRTAGEQGSMSPAEKERWVRLLPVMRSMAKGLRMSARLEAFGPVDGKPGHTLYEMSDKDLAAGDGMIDALVYGRKPVGAKLRKHSYTVMIAEPFDPEDGRSERSGESGSLPQAVEIPQPLAAGTGNLAKERSRVLVRVDKEEQGFASALTLASLSPASQTASDGPAEKRLLGAVRKIVVGVDLKPYDGPWALRAYDEDILRAATQPADVLQWPLLEINILDGRARQERLSHP